MALVPSLVRVLNWLGSVAHLRADLVTFPPNLSCFTTLEFVYPSEMKMFPACVHSDIRWASRNPIPALRTPN